MTVKKIEETPCGPVIVTTTPVKSPWYLAYLKMLKGFVFMGLAAAALYASGDVVNWQIPEPYKQYAIAALGSIFIGIYKYFTAKNDIITATKTTEEDNKNTEN